MMSTSGTSGGLQADAVHIELGGREVVRGVSLDVRSGEILALVGPNGCGKSTLLSALAGLRRPTAGSIYIGGREIDDFASRDLARQRSFVTQHNRVDTPFTVAEIVEMGRYPWLRTPQAAESLQIIERAITDCDLVDVADRPFPQLSGGQQARVSLARAIAQRAPVMLLDEPTAALDIRHQEQVLDVLADSRSAGTAVLLVVHDLSLAAAYADRVAVMKDGLLLDVGPTREVMTSELLSSTYDHPVRVIDYEQDTIVLPVRDRADHPRRGSDHHPGRGSDDRH